MTLSPFEVERREFGKSALGYRTRDVDHFIDEVQRSLRDLWQERSDTREENERLKERLTRFEQIEDQLKNTLLLAQDSAEKAHEQARRESELIMREASQKSRDIVHLAHEEKQKLEMVLRDLHGAEQEARQRLRAMSGAILSHLDDTEALVQESTGNFRAVVQAYPEASELQSSSAEAVGEIAERAAMAADASAIERHRISLDADLVAEAAERLSAAEEAGSVGRPARMRRTDSDAAFDLVTEPFAGEAGDLGTGVASTELADAFFDAPPTFDASEVKRRGDRTEVEQA
ncbi:MAG: hypothetical protein JWM98_1233 [Thermoleophilia bacterium]|nr:hypothetical protein [Thermoleophilia bacterium]